MCHFLNVRQKKAILGILCHLYVTDLVTRGRIYFNPVHHDNPYFLIQTQIDYEGIGSNFRMQLRVELSNGKIKYPKMGES